MAFVRNVIVDFLVAGFCTTIRLLLCHSLVRFVRCAAFFLAAAATIQRRSVVAPLRLCDKLAA